jgi:uncharacterized repeat protein (TIGR01451 family)
MSTLDASANRLVTGKLNKVGAVLAIVGLLGLACSASIPQQGQAARTVGPSRAAAHPLVFIDPAIDHVQHLLQGVVDGAEVVVLDSSRDGVTQIAEYLSGRKDLSSVHIVANGDVGCVALGSTDLCLENLAEHAPQLQSWAGALGAGEHGLPLLLYGCNVAAGQAGAAFVAQLHRLTGAEIMASDDATGGAALGGDWQLEVSTGPQSVSLVFSTQVLSSYGDILDGNFVWARRAGGASSHDEAMAAALDSAGNLYLTGYFFSSDFDPGDGSSVASNGSSDVFVDKWDKDGSFVWSRQIGGAGAERGQGIAVDGAGNVYVTGFFQGGPVDFDPGPGIAGRTGTGSGREIFVLKLDTGGAFQWVQHVAGNGSSHWDEGLAIAVDSSDASVYVTGYFEGGPVDFDPGPGTSNLTSGGGEDIFILQLAASDGSFGWAAQAVGLGNHDDRGQGIAVDSAGDLYVTGFFMGQVGFGATDLTPQGKDAFVVKLSSGGAFEWAGQFGGSSSSDYDEGKGIAVDGAGSVYVTGFFEGTADFDPGPGTSNLTSSGLEDVFVAKLASSGAYAWARRIGNSNTDQGRDIAVDGAGNVYVTGDFQGTVDFDPGPGSVNLASDGSGKDLFVVRLSSSGSFAWARRVGKSGTDRGQAIAADSTGGDHIAGFFQNIAVDFDPGAGIAILNSAGGDDIYLLKLDAPPLTDLSIAKQAVRSNEELNGVITYTITVNNGGPTAAPGAIVSDPIPAGVTAFVWTCTGAGGATCPDAGPTGGAIHETSGPFPSGGQLVYTVRATLVSSDTVIINTATVTTLNGLDDPQEDNNSATSVSHPTYRMYLPMVSSQ